MADLEAEKARAAKRAVEEVRDGMLIGLGTGSTAAYAIRELGARVKAGLKIDVVATSTAADKLAREAGLAPLDFGGVARVDITIDGADRINPNLEAIKGGGGALLREKIVGAASDRLIIIVDSSKPVELLGGFPLPLEVLPFAHAWVTRAITDIGAKVRLRRQGNGEPFLTDQGNLILDVDLGEIEAPVALANQLDLIPGIIEHGLFVSEIDCAIIGRGDQVDIVYKSDCRGKS
ncbi:ribose-5-phosphate isomerase RpiA [Pseudomonas sp. B14-6]|uniref:ribose-5-phosphate isomerase RpiA n=1 Tax=Pseudomonas sp. B14-6 TaxID=2738843 RepID=UPI00155DF44F|nr:ribose-5-phosphate isomerase RpiA [Pseudomonas sp. B14-6]QKG67329.1 ribose-5-phosphate isomerase RpiA [Pseudomonas sp. B14-6]